MGDHGQQQNMLVAGNSDDFAAPPEQGTLYPLVNNQLAFFEADCDTWPNHWRRKGQPWRTEPEIDSKRQAELLRRLTSEGELAPFAGTALGRADLEWLLARYEESSAERYNHALGASLPLDLRGADLRKARLRGLPLAGLCGGPRAEEWLLATDQQREAAAVRLEGADLRDAHLEDANLCSAHLEDANLCGAHLEGANLRGAYLAGTNLCGAHLEGTDLRDAHLEGTEAMPKPANLRMAFLDGRTRLKGLISGNERYGFVTLSDVHWNSANLAEVDWSEITRLGEEREVQWRLPVEYLAAIRANRQLAIALRAQGMNEQADYFLYRAYVNQAHMLPQRAMLPVVLRVFVRERMPLPKVLLRLEERRLGERYPRHPITSALLRFIPSCLLLLALAIFQPLVFLLFCTACVASLLFVFSISRKRAQHPPEYRRAQPLFPPPDLLPQQQRRRLQWLLLLAFLLGTSKAQLALLLESPEIVLGQMPVLRRLGQQRFLSFLLILLLLFDDTLVCYGRYLFSALEYALTGFGFKLVRSVTCYLLVLLGFSALYYILMHQSFWDAFVLSLTSFHGLRLLLNGGTLVGNFPGVLSIAEAALGLIIEVTVVTALIQRFLRK